jgi:hypothetical protein
MDGVDGGTGQQDVQLAHGLVILTRVIGVPGASGDPAPPPLTPQAVDIRVFGAVGDGVTDDRAAIQAAIDDAGGRPLYFPPTPDGWAIGSPLRLRHATHLVGDHTPSYFPPNFRPSYIKALPAFTGAGMIEVLDKSLTGHTTDPQGGSIEGLCLDGASVASAGIFWQGTSADWTIRDVEVFKVTTYGFRSEGLGIAPQQELAFFNCHAWQDVGLPSGNGWWFANRSYDHQLHACVAHHLNDGFVTHVQTASIQYVSCRAEWCASAGFVAFDGDKVTYEGCVTDRNGNSGWHIDVGANDRPLVLSHCYANRDGRNGAGLSGVRIVSGEQLVINGLATATGGDDGGGGMLSPAYGIDAANATVQLGDCRLEGATSGFKDSGGNTIAWTDRAPAGVAWAPLAYSNKWRAYAGAADAFGQAAVRKIGDVVHLRGLIDKQGGNWIAGEPMFTLPPGYRPLPGTALVFPVLVYDSDTHSVGRIDIYDSGLVVLQAGGVENPVVWLSLAGIQFPIG